MSIGDGVSRRKSHEPGCGRLGDLGERFSCCDHGGWFRRIARYRQGNEMLKGLAGSWVGIVLLVFEVETQEDYEEVEA